MMGLGTLLVLIFSDPMVDVLGEIGNRTGIPAFYISFVLAPMASISSIQEECKRGVLQRPREKRFFLPMYRLPIGPCTHTPLYLYTHT